MPSLEGSKDSKCEGRDTMVIISRHETKSSWKNDQSMNDSIDGPIASQYPGEEVESTVDQHQAPELRQVPEGNTRVCVGGEVEVGQFEPLQLSQLVDGGVGGGNLLRVG